MHLVWRPWVRFYDIQGRSGRTEYLVFHLLFVAVIAGLVYAAVTFDPQADGRVGPVGDKLLIAAGVFFLVAMVPLWTLAVRRLHDQDLSGWMVFLSFVPIANIYIALTCLFSAGSDGWNSYGPDPRYPDSGLPGDA